MQESIHYQTFIILVYLAVGEFFMNFVKKKKKKDDKYTDEKVPEYQ